MFQPSVHCNLSAIVFVTTIGPCGPVPNIHDQGYNRNEYVEHNMHQSNEQELSCVIRGECGNLEQMSTS